MSVDDYIAAMPEGMGGLNEKMGIELTEISAERVVGTMPVEGNTQPYGLLHGGASVVLAARRSMRRSRAGAELAVEALARQQRAGDA